MDLTFRTIEGESEGMRRTREFVCQSLCAIGLKDEACRAAQASTLEHAESAMREARSEAGGASAESSSRRLEDGERHVDGDEYALEAMLVGVASLWLARSYVAAIRKQAGVADARARTAMWLLRVSTMHIPPQTKEAA